MLLRRLAVAAPSPLELGFHARVTVVCGLDEQRRLLVADVVESALRGRLDGLVGRFEVDGTARDLTPETYAALRLPDPLPDVRLRRSDLRVPAPEAEVAAAEAGLAASAGPLDSAREALSAADARRRAVADNHAQLAAKDNQASWGRRQAAEGLAALDQRLAEAHDRRTTLGAVRPPADPGPVAAATRRLGEARAAADELRAKTQSFVARWDEVTAELDRLPDADDAAGQAVLAGELADAQRDLAAAEATAGLLGFASADIAALEAAHEAVGQAEQRAKRRLGGPGGKRRLEAAHRAERDLLARMGLGSYADLLLMTAVPAFDVDAQRRIDQSRARIERARSLTEHGLDPTDQERRRELLAERERLWSDAASLAGTTRDDPEAATRLKALATSIGLAEAEALATALAEESGRPPPPAVTPADQVLLLEAARQWLAVAEPGWEGFAGLPVAELADVDDELARLASERVELEADAALAEEQRQELVEPLEQAAAALAVAEKEVAEATAAARAAEETWRAAERRCADLRGLAAPPGPAPDLEDLSESVEVHVLGRVSAQRAVGAAGPLPLVVDDALLALPDSARDRALSLLARMSETVQVIYLTGDPRVEEWAERLGPAAAIVRAP